MNAECPVCPRRCVIADGRTGYCGARKNEGGRITCDNYGMVTSMSLDPIEKKPFRKYYPGSSILSVGSYGCNLRCPWCQNHGISMPDIMPGTTFVAPGTLVEKALSLKETGNIGIAFTYNEPLIGYEYVMDCARLAGGAGLRTALVTNGNVNETALRDLLPFIDAMNIDLKGFRAELYEMIGGDLESVKSAISISAVSAHIEVTTLIVPGENDSENEMEELSSWLSSINEEIPLHVSRFFPRHKYSDKRPTPLETIHALAGVARRHLRHVYTGNC